MRDSKLSEEEQAILRNMKEMELQYSTGRKRGVMTVMDRYYLAQIVATRELRKFGMILEIHRFDATQEAFAGIIRAERAYIPELSDQSLETWLYFKAMYAVIDYVRREAKHHLSQHLPNKINEYNMGYDNPAGYPTILKEHKTLQELEEDIYADRMSDLADKAKLTVKQRAVLDLTLTGLTYAQIGKRLGIAEGTAKATVSQVISKIKKGVIDNGN